MSQPNCCPECGAELPLGALGGLCPKCLLAAGLESGAVAGQVGSGSEAPTTPHVGSFVPPDAASLAAHFPQLEILELLGHGGMGAVYKARQPKLDRLVALKIIRPEAADDPAFAERFNREARMLARLSHPHIVAVYDFGEVNLSAAEIGAAPRQLYFFLMEYIDGTSLRQLLQAGELLPQQALAIVPQICEALQFAHDEGVVHRDIKPENILLDKRGRVKIADFGLAKLAAGSPQDFTLTGTHQVMGTPRYMAPEQMEGSHAVDHRADIYSLGVVFYEMLTGEVPMGHFEPPSKKVEVDVRLDEVVLRTLAREPSRRYQHASDVKTDLESISSHQRDVVAPVSKPSRVLLDDDEMNEFVRHQVRRPAIGLIAFAGLNLLFVLAFLIGTLVDVEERGWEAAWLETLEFGPVLLTGMALSIPISVLSIIAAVRMMNFRSYRLAVTAAVLAMLPIEVTVVLGLPIGIWALVVLSKPEMKRGFALRQRRTQGEFKPQSEIARSIVNPAWGLIITGIISWVTIPLAFSVPFIENMKDMNAAQRAVFQISFGAVPLVIGTIMALAGFRMKRLEGYRLAMFAAVLPIVVLIFKLIGLSFDTLAIGPADLVGAPVGLWVLVVLTRSDVKAAFHGSRSEQGPAPRTARGTIGQAWDEWWAERDRWFTSTVLAVLLVVHIGCLAMFLALRGGGGYDSGRPSAWHHVGWPTPWFVYELGIEPNVYFRRTINLLSSSILIAGIGMLAWYAVWRIQLVRDARHARLWQTVGSPTAVLIVWILAGAAFAWLGVRAADRLYESMTAQMAPIDSQRAAEALGLEQHVEPNAPPRVLKHDDRDNSEAFSKLGFDEMMSRPLTQNWIMTSDGPVLADGFVRVGLELDATQTDEVKRILQAAYADYLKIEQRHLEQQMADDGHLTITIKPHPEAVAKLEDRLWTQLDAVLDPEQQRIARLNLQLEPPEAAADRALTEIVGPGFFGWGKDGAEIEIRELGTWYHWKVKTRGYEYDTEMDRGEAPQLPEWLRRYWKEPHGQATSPRSDG